MGTAYLPEDEEEMAGGENGGKNYALDHKVGVINRINTTNIFLMHKYHVPHNRQQTANIVSDSIIPEPQHSTSQPSIAELSC